MKGTRPMSVQFKVDGFNYSYNNTELIDALQGKNLDAPSISTVLKEIGKGDLTSLRSMGLVKYVAVSPVVDMTPRSGADFASLSVAMGKAGHFNFMEVMLALHQAAQGLRQAGREMRHSERDAAMAEAMNAAAKIRSEAWINLATGIVSGVVNIGMGVASAMAGNNQGKLQTISGAFGGADKTLSAIGGFFAAGERAKGAEHTAAAQKASSMENEAAEFQKSYEELMQSVQGIIKEYQQSQNQISSSIYRNM